MNIHVIGVGAIGSLLAAHLRRTLPTTSTVTLMLRQPHYSVAKNSYGPNTPIAIHRGGDAPLQATGFKWEVVPEVPNRNGFEASASERSRGGGSGSTSQSNLLRDLVFKDDGSVRKGFGLNSQGLEGYTAPDMRHPAQVEKDKKYHYFQRIAQEYKHELEESNTPIQNLLVTTKANSVLPAVSAIRHRLSPSSTIVLLNNGMGVYERLVSELYQNAEERPHFVIGAIAHGAWRKNKNVVVHTTTKNAGTIRFGIVPDWRGRDFERSYWEESNEKKAKLKMEDIVSPSAEEESDGLTSRQDYRSLYQLIDALLSLEDLQPSWKPISEIQTFLRQKLAANCVINPLTTLLQVRNGDVFALPGSKALCAGLCKEAADVFAKEAQLQSGSERVKFKVDPTLRALDLETYTQLIARVTGQNYSSMLVDVRRGAPTEIGYLNGYVVRRGEELGIPTPYQAMLASLVRMKWHTGKGQFGLQ